MVSRRRPRQQRLSMYCCCCEPSYWRCPLLAVSIYVTVRCPSFCLSRRSIAAATCSWFAAPLARAEISIGGCGRRRSAANAGSFLLRVDKGVSSTQTCYTRYRQKPTRLQTEITAVCLTVGELPNSKQQGGGRHAAAIRALATTAVATC